MSETLSFPRLIGARELARMLGVSYPTVKLWGARGRLDSLRIRVGAHYKYDVSKVEEHIKAGAIANHAA